MSSEMWTLPIGFVFAVRASEQPPLSACVTAIRPKRRVLPMAVSAHEGSPRKRWPFSFALSQVAGLEASGDTAW